MSKVTHMLVCIMLTSCFCFASSVCFGSFQNLICLASPETGVAFLQEDYCTHQNLLEYFFSWDWCLHLSLSLLTLFVIWHSGTTWFKYRFSYIKSVDYFVCCICRYGLDQALFHQLKVIWLDVPLMPSLFILHNFLATARKIIYAACSIQAGRIFIGQN